MYKLFIDTNKYLDFYRTKEENKEILNQLSSSSDLVLTDQVIDEFRRNRNSELKSLKNRFEEKYKLVTNNMFGIEPNGILLKEIDEINKRNKQLTIEIKQNIEPLVNKVKEMLDNPSTDNVLQAFNRIVYNEKNIVLRHNDSYYNLALKRNELGGVPRSEKSNFKHLTICDEYIWETLLNESKWDLIFVTRDNTYLDNKNLLEDEYNTRTGKRIIFTEMVSQGLELIGKKISMEAKEKEEIETISQYNKMRLENAIGFEFDLIVENFKILTSEEKNLIKMRFGFDGETYTLAEIAEKYNYKNREEVRQLEAKTIRKLKVLMNKKYDERRVSYSLEELEAAENEVC